MNSPISQQQPFARDALFIGGRWERSSGSEWIDVVSPSTEEWVGRVPLAVADDIDRAVVSAEAAFREGPWPKMSIDERAIHLRRVMACLQPRSMAAIDLQIDEMGGTRKSLEMYTAGQPAALERAIGDAVGLPQAEVRDGAVGKVVVLREPIGVAAGIIPWNGPVNVALSKLIPSLLAGCPIVLKPAQESPLSAYLLAEALEEADLPPGVVSIVAGGREAGSRLVANTTVRKVSFTGSSVVGAEIAAVCGQQLKSATLELGGKSAAIFLDGDLETYVPLLIRLALQNAGQVCVAPTRLLVHRDRHDVFVDLVRESMAALKVGNPYDRDVDVGPLVSERQRARVEMYIESGLAEGATIALGGGRPAGCEAGWYVEPTLFVGANNSMRIAREEIFGPVLTVIPFDSEEEAISIANDSPYGLAGVVYADDPDHGFRVARRIESGTFAVNNGPPAGGGGPFGGYKHSGMGRERGPEGIAAFLEVKSVTFPAGYSPCLEAVSCSSTK